MIIYVLYRFHPIIARARQRAVTWADGCLDDDGHGYENDNKQADCFGVGYRCGAIYIYIYSCYILDYVYTMYIYIYIYT